MIIGNPTFGHLRVEPTGDGNLRVTVPGVCQVILDAAAESALLKFLTERDHQNLRADLRRKAAERRTAAIVEPVDRSIEPTGREP